MKIIKQSFHLKTMGASYITQLIPNVMWKLMYVDD